MEDLVQKLSRNLPKLIDLRTFEHMTLKIIRSKYIPDAEYKSEGSHSHNRSVQFTDTKGTPYALSICKRQHGSENFISSGVFKIQVQHLSEITGIPYKFLEAYIKGSGNLYKRYIQELEEKYGI